MLIFVLACSQHIPSITSITQKLTKRLGESVNLHCNVNYASEILWMKLGGQFNNEPVPLTVGDTTIIPNSRITLEHKYGSSKYSLKVLINCRTNLWSNKLIT